MENYCGNVWKNSLNLKQYLFKNTNSKEFYIRPNCLSGYIALYIDTPIIIADRNDKSVIGMTIPTTKEVIAALTEIVEYVENKEEKK